MGSNLTSSLSSDGTTASIQDIIKQACAKISVLLGTAEKIPIEPRAVSVNGERVWYVPSVEEGNYADSRMASTRSVRWR